MRDIFIDKCKELIISDDLKSDAYNFLIKHNKFRIAEHSMRVAEKCIVLASQYGMNEKLAETAGLLHDISGVYANDERLSMAKDLNLEILLEEQKLPLILHQKISEVMAREIFQIDEEEVLSAIQCHTTLKKDASKMDMLLFIADKLEWDQEGVPPYFKEVEQGTQKSLEEGAFAYLKHQWKNKENLAVVHPWLEEAYLELSSILWNTAHL